MPGIVGCFKRNGNMEKKYNINFDILTILACLMVVFFHCNMLFYDYSDTLSWKTSVIERCIVYSAIPIFFMLTGAKLMEYRKRYSTKEFAKKRLLRVGIPFVFWNVFYILFNTFMGRKFVADSPKEFISMFLNDKHSIWDISSCFFDYSFSTSFTTTTFIVSSIFSVRISLQVHFI